MDRVTVYPAEIPLVEDVLDGQRNAYIAVGHLAQLALGSQTAAAGFSVSSSGLQLSVNPGAIYAVGEVDASAYGELAADTSPLVQQFLSPGITHLTAPASSTSYVYATIKVLDADPAVLPFYNAVNPSQTFSGQNNSGSALPTRRRNVATVAIGATIPPGAIPLWKVVATASAVTVTAAPAAPFYTTLAQASLRICAPFDPVLAAAAGGYPKGIVLPDSTSPGVFWVSTADANTTVPGAAGAKWKSLFSGLAALNGGNTFSGGAQQINADNIVTPFLVKTSAGQGFELGLAQDTSYIDFHSASAGNGADYDSRIIATGDITKGTNSLDFESSNLTWAGRPLATEAWADLRYLILSSTSAQTVTGPVVFSGSQGKSAQIANAPASPVTGIGGDVPNTWWVDQYYARATALAAEVQARANADTALNNAKANLAGGNDFTGNQTFENTVTFTGATGFNAKITNAPADPTTGVGGDVPNTYWVDTFYARKTALDAESQARASADSTLQTNISNETQARVAADALKANLAGGNDFTGNQTFENTVTFTGATGFNAKITNAPADPTTGVGGDVPNTYWVDTFYARKASLPKSGTITNGYWIKVGNILVQSFVIPVAYDGLYIAFPIAYAAGTKPVVIGIGGSTSDAWTSWLTAGVYPNGDSAISNTGMTLSMPQQKAASAGLVTSSNPTSARITVMGTL